MDAITTDLVVIGGGINGCGIAADAAGRGLGVVLIEQDDLASGTSSRSSKLIHGGLRYLEHHEYRLVREALAEREVLLAKAPHIVWPLRFVLPHVAGLRPPWMIRAGLFLYDHLARRRTIPGSAALDLQRDPAGRPLRGEITSGYAYWDCWVDDARLVVANARAAAARGARIMTRTRAAAIAADGHRWRVRIEPAPSGAAGPPREISALALVNAAGPWADRVAASIEAPAAPPRPHLRLVKGSHIVVPRIAGADDAYLLQSPDKRVVFALPFEERFTIVGTTDVPFTGDPASVAIDGREESYLLDIAARFFRAPPAREAIAWRFAGVRPLYDDATDDPSAVTRDYRLDLAAGGPLPPLLTVLGGKVTTYRRLAEEALDLIARHLPRCGPAWTAAAPLPGGDIPRGDFRAFLAEVAAERPGFDAAALMRLARRHGSDVRRLLGGARAMADLGRDLGAGLTEREVEWLGAEEWATTPDDVLWRRTKAGLHLSRPEREAAAERIAALLAGAAATRTVAQATG